MNRLPAMNLRRSWRALGYEHQTKEETVRDIRLLFADQNEIPDWALDYVRVAWDHRLMIGYEKNDVVTFRPKRQITRAEVTTVISRIDAMTASEADLPELHGKVVDIEAGTDVEQVTMLTADEARYVMTLRGDASIYVEGRAAELTELENGMDVIVILDQEGRISYLKALTEELTRSVYHIFNGIVIDNLTDENQGAFTIRLNEKAAQNEIEFRLTEQTVIYVDHEQATPADIVADMQVSVLAEQDDQGVYIAKEVRVFIK